MDAFSKLVLARCVSLGANTKPTNFANLNEILNGGLPQGRLVEIYGRSQIGKSLLALSLFPNEMIVYLDLTRKICPSYLTDKIFTVPNINNQEAFDLMFELVHENLVIVIDDLTMLGSIRNDVERFNWLSKNFMTLQRELVSTSSIVIVLNQIRVSPSTGKSYNPHDGCMDAAVKIKMHFAEKKANADLVYLEVEKDFWGKEGARCTLLVSKLDVTVPSFYQPNQLVDKQESEL